MVLHSIALDIIIYHWILHSFNVRPIGLYLARHMCSIRIMYACIYIICMLIAYLLICIFACLHILICFTYLQYDKLWGLPRRVFTLSLNTSFSGLDIHKPRPRVREGVKKTYSRHEF